RIRYGFAALAPAELALAGEAETDGLRVRSSAKLLVAVPPLSRRRAFPHRTDAIGCAAFIRRRGSARTLHTPCAAPPPCRAGRAPVPAASRCASPVHRAS